MGRLRTTPGNSLKYQQLIRDTDSRGETLEEHPGELKLQEDNGVLADPQYTWTHYMSSKIMSPCLNTINRLARGNFLYRGG